MFPIESNLIVGNRFTRSTPIDALPAFSRNIRQLFPPCMAVELLATLQTRGCAHANQLKRRTPILEPESDFLSPRARNHTLELAGSPILKT